MNYTIISNFSNSISVKDEFDGKENYEDFQNGTISVNKYFIILFILSFQ